MRTLQLAVITLTSLFCQAGIAQMDVQLLVNWDKRRPSAYENFYQVIAASNGYIIAVGETLGPNLGDTDALFTVIEAENGREFFRKSFGGTGDQCFYSVVQNFDGTFTLVGYTRPGAKTPSQGWIVWLDLEGNVLMEKKFPGTGDGNVALRHIAINSEGTALAAGWQNEQKPDGIWLLQIGHNDIQEHTVRGGALGKPQGLAAGADGAFVLTGSTAADDRTHPSDAWVLKVDKDGRDLWSGPKYFGDKAWQEGRGIIATSDGGYALAASSSSKGGGMADMWLVKLDKDGDVEWEQTYGGHADDIAVAVTELSEGGFALFGQTWSNLPKARYSTLELLVTDLRGNELDKNTYAIRQVREEGNEIAHSLVESFNGDLVIAGSSNPNSGKPGVFPSCQVSAISYKPIDSTPKPRQNGELYGSETNRLIGVSSATFVDANSNRLLESNERGYMLVEISNNSAGSLRNVSGRIIMDNAPSGLDFWDNVKVGAIRAGQKKRLIVPVMARGSLSSGVYALNINVEVDGAVMGSTVATLESNRPEPPKLLAEGIFNPTSPKAGETVTLGIRLINAGGAPTQPLEARLNVPPGLNFFGSDKVQIPSLAPNERRDLTFSFSYDQNYPAKSVDFRFEASGPEILPLVKTFRLNIGNQPVPVVAAADGYMAWVSHEPRKEAIDVINREVSLKVVAIAKNRLEQDKFSILINGKRVEGQKMDEAQLTPPGERNDQYYSNVIQLKEGPNSVQIVYQGEASFASPTITFNYTPPDKPNLYVLTIGVPYDNLEYTVKDATDIANAYLKLKNDKGRVFKDINVYPLLKKEESTTLNIKKAFVELENMRRIKNGDLVIVFISSHGKVTHDNEFILIPSDYEAAYESVTSINFETDVLNRLRNIPGNKLVFIDACHSGKAALGSKSYSEAAASKFLNDLLQATAGLEIFASCGDNEYSYEDASWGNGAFTKAIIEAFNNETVEVDGKMISADIYADNPETGRMEKGSDGVITIGELKEFLVQRVPYLVRTVKREQQHPHNRSTDLLPENTGIYLVNKKEN